MPADTRLLALARELLALAAPARHGPGFGCAWWFGTYYTFTAAQARVVAVLWAAWENGTPDVRQELLLEAAGSEGGRLAHVFRRHPAWGSLIVPGPSKGLFRLAESSITGNTRANPSPGAGRAPPGG